MLNNFITNVRAALIGKPHSATSAAEFYRGMGCKEPAREIAQMAVEIVKAGGAWTVTDLAEHICGKGVRVDADGRRVADYIHQYLTAQWKKGEIARAEVHQVAGQGRPSVVRYARNWKDL